MSRRNWLALLCRSLERGNTRLAHAVAEHVGVRVRTSGVTFTDDESADAQRWRRAGNEWIRRMRLTGRVASALPLTPRTRHDESRIAILASAETQISGDRSKAVPSGGSMPIAAPSTTRAAQNRCLAGDQDA